MFVQFGGALLSNLNLSIAAFFVIVVLILFLLQFFNELFQFLDKDRDKKYGSKKGFLRNSRKDWALFLLGLFLGSIFFMLVVSLF
jgi:hypothetical protein